MAFAQPYQSPRSRAAQRRRVVDLATAAISTLNNLYNAPNQRRSLRRERGAESGRVKEIHEYIISCVFGYVDRPLVRTVNTLTTTTTMEELLVAWPPKRRGAGQGRNSLRDLQLDRATFLAFAVGATESDL